MVIDRTLCIYEYERLLMGGTEKTLSRLLGAPKNENGKPNLATANLGRIIVGHIWHYAVTEILEWTPQQAAMYMDDDIVKTLMLDKTLSLIGITKRRDMHMPDYRFALQYAFPGEVIYGDDNWAIDVYKKCAHIEEYRHSSKKYEYPKGFWAERNRAKLILKYLIDLYFSDQNIYELYDFFADTKAATEMLKKYALQVPLKNHFRCPLEFLNEMLEDSGMDDECYYEELMREIRETEIEKIMKFASFVELPDSAKNAVRMKDYVGYVRVYFRGGKYGSRLFFKGASNGTAEEISAAEERGRARYNEDLKHALETVCNFIFEESSPYGREDLYKFCERKMFDETADGYTGYCYMNNAVFRIAVSKSDDYFCRVYFFDISNS